MAIRDTNERGLTKVSRRIERTVPGKAVMNAYELGVHPDSPITITEDSRIVQQGGSTGITLGNWEVGATYEPNRIIVHNQHIYRSTEHTAGVEPGTEEVIWINLSLEAEVEELPDGSIVLSKLSQELQNTLNTLTSGLSTAQTSITTLKSDVLTLQTNSRTTAQVIQLIQDQLPDPLIAGDNITFTRTPEGNIVISTEPSTIDTDTNTTYTFLRVGNNLRVTGSDGSTTLIDLTTSIPDTNTTYTFAINGNVITATDSNGVVTNIPLPASITYTVTIEDRTITFTGSDNSIQTIELPAGSDINQDDLTDILTRVVALENAINTKAGYANLNGRVVNFYPNEASFTNSETPIFTFTLPEGGSGGGGGTELTQEQLNALTQVATNVIAIAENKETADTNKEDLDDILTRGTEERELIGASNIGVEGIDFIHLFVSTLSSDIDPATATTQDLGNDFENLESEQGTFFNAQIRANSYIILLGQESGDFSTSLVKLRDSFFVEVGGVKYMKDDFEEFSAHGRIYLKTKNFIGQIGIGNGRFGSVGTITTREIKDTSLSQRILNSVFQTHQQTTSRVLNALQKFINTNKELSTDITDFSETIFFGTEDDNLRLVNSDGAFLNSGNAHLIGIPDTSGHELTEVIALEIGGSFTTTLTATETNSVSREGYTFYTIQVGTFNAQITLRGKEILSDQVTFAENVKIVFNSLPERVKNIINLFVLNDDGTYRFTSNLKIGIDNIGDTALELINRGKLTAKGLIVINNLIPFLRDVQTQRILVDDVEEISYDLAIASDRTATENVDKLNIAIPAIQGEDSSNYLTLPANAIDPINSVISFGFHNANGEGHTQEIFRWGNLSLKIINSKLIYSYDNGTTIIDYGQIETGNHIFAITFYQNNQEQTVISVSLNGAILGTQTYTKAQVVASFAVDVFTHPIRFGWDGVVTERPVISKIDFRTHSSEIIDEDTNTFINTVGRKRAGYFRSKGKQLTGNNSLWGLYEIQEVSLEPDGTMVVLVEGDVREMADYNIGFTFTTTFDHPERPNFTIDTIGQIESPRFSFETNRYEADGINDETRAVVDLTDGQSSTYIIADNQTRFLFFNINLEGHTTAEDYAFWLNGDNVNASQATSVDVEVTHKTYNGLNSTRLLGSFDWITIFKIEDIALFTNSILQTISSVIGSTLYEGTHQQRLVLTVSPDGSTTSDVVLPTWEEIQPEEVVNDAGETENHYTIAKGKQELSIQTTLTRVSTTIEEDELALNFDNRILINRLEGEVDIYAVDTHNPQMAETGGSSNRIIASRVTPMPKKPNGDQVVRITNLGGDQTEITSVQVI